MSSSINGLGLLLVGFPLKLSINGPYIFSSFLISATYIRQFDIILVDNMCLEFFTVGSPKSMYIFLDNSALSIFLLVNPTTFASTVVTTMEFDKVYLGLKTYSPCLFPLIFIVRLLV